MTTKSGNHTVGAVTTSGIILLPDLSFGLTEIYEFSNSGNYRYKDGERIPTAQALQVAFAFRDQLVALRNSQIADAETTPPPEWASESSYRLPGEYALESDINEISRKLGELAAEQDSLRDRLANAGELRSLLFGTGKQLESAVRKALESIGFLATSYVDDNSEFDVVFEASEGRFIGEVEGRDTSAINVAKISQLRRNVDEDFARDEVSEPARGVLFGNGFRLEDPASRSECFTSKVITSAPTLAITLVRTTDLFRVAKFVLETGDQQFAKKCREAIRDAVGRIVDFPSLDQNEMIDEVSSDGPGDRAD